MAIRVNLRLIDELVRYGAEDVQYCYHCGDCSTVCPHADAVFRFPRKSMRQLQMGLEQRIETTLEPWLCYYCGQCSEQCPREADPGETMMGLRRWLIARYDITGIARQFFKSKTVEIISVIVVGIITGALLLYYGFSQGNLSIYDGEGAFLPSSFIHTFDLIIGIIMVFFLIVNALNMGYLTMRKGCDYPVPWWIYIKKLLVLPWHFFTQKRYAECENKRETKIFMPWFIHMGLAFGYMIMLILVMVFIEKLQYGPEIDWSVHIFGYLASVGLIIGCIYFIRSRFRKHHIQYKKTHSTDWVFVVLLLIITVTGIAQHILHRTGIIEWANIIYVVHLICVAPWFLRMPFSKWSHLVYRPLAMYFAAVRREALERQEEGLPSISYSYK
ncbi:MAG: 4Fe-4S dicluster domain-containing protein [Bacteroidetes bacterium]|nr:4Fe-4S dicluster domain-containing protein [Bacteroidota bacterium]MBT4401651.1 4Fe-4S dicluster domain-containing protein [Bacteroidota bacterium]MBT4411225.1 4Fe-4S dicluster domain-containing protein [Bacteroidota bacterium]MBT7092869.1 4Fe-4S dicluster domain-containing protein [Bacteroidota bacterium]MBT7463756.1 4Fe-4S dicluster domain-containing protein [Bacteroidota bacterium]